MVYRLSSHIRHDNGEINSATKYFSSFEELVDFAEKALWAINFFKGKDRSQPNYYLRLFYVIYRIFTENWPKIRGLSGEWQVFVDKELMLKKLNEVLDLWEKFEGFIYEADPTL